MCRRMFNITLLVVITLFISGCAGKLWKAEAQQSATVVPILVDVEHNYITTEGIDFKKEKTDKLKIIMLQALEENFSKRGFNFIGQELALSNKNLAEDQWKLMMASMEAKYDLVFYWQYYYSGMFSMNKKFPEDLYYLDKKKIEALNTSNAKYGVFLDVHDNDLSKGVVAGSFFRSLGNVVTLGFSEMLMGSKNNTHKDAKRENIMLGIIDLETQEIVYFSYDFMARDYLNKESAYDAVNKLLNAAAYGTGTPFKE